MKIALIGCSASKQGKDDPTKMFKAQDIYTGYNFKKSKDIGVNMFECDDFYIISALHGLLDKDDLIAYYNVSLYDEGMTADVRKQWAKKIIDELNKKFDLKNDEFYIFASDKYYEYLVKHLNCTVFKYNRWHITFDIKSRYRNGR